MPWNIISADLGRGNNWGASFISSKHGIITLCKNATWDLLKVSCLQWKEVVWIFFACYPGIKLFFSAFLFFADICS